MIYFKLDTLTVILILTISSSWTNCESVTETTSIVPLEYTTVIHNDSEVQSETFEVTTDLSQTQAPTTTGYEDARDVEYLNTTEEEELQITQHQNYTEEETLAKEGYQESHYTESVLMSTETTAALDEYQTTYAVTEDKFGYVTDTTQSEDGTTLLPETDSTTPSDEDFTTTYQPLILDNSVFKDVRIEDNLVDVDMIQEDLDHLLDADAEKEDEKDDLKIFEAVVNSMAEYNLMKQEKKRHNRRVKRDEELVCYKDLGCFKDEGPFDLMDMLPSKPEEVNTLFLLYTRENKDREQLIMYQNISSILNSNFDRNRPTKVIVHGFGSSCSRVWVREMRQTFLHRMDVNVICVNWENGASVPNYVRAASNSRLVGAQLAVLLETLQHYMNTSLDDLHLVGFSLGAHVAGFTGHRLQNVARISGLDPAGPLFEEYPEKMRLDASDARFVDVIHTNADSLIMGGLGAFQPMGHVDFYPNGGRMQKGCANLFVGGVSDILWPTEGDGRYLCNHRRGYKYFTASVTPQCIFPSFVCRDYETFLKGDCFPCKNCGKMGYFAEEAVGRGQLYLVTSEMEPFCANQYKVAVFHSGGPPAEEFTSYGSVDVTFVAQNGLNETLPLTRSEDQEMVAGGTTTRIMVPHPAISDIQAVQLRYTAYHGWIYSGYKSWAIDKISVMDSFGKIVTFCNLGTTLVSSKTMHFTLLPGDCSPLDAQPVAYVKPWQVQDPVPETETNNASTEGDGSGKVPLQTVPAPQSDPNHKTSQDNGSAPNIASAIPPNPNHILQSDKPIPKPILTPMEPHGGVLAAPGDSQHPLLAITLEVPPKLRTKVQTFSSQSSSHFDIIGVTEEPNRLEDVNEHFVNDVAVSSEEPVNIIPAPNLALKHNINISLDSDTRRPSNGMTPPPNDKNYEEIHKEDSTTPKVFTIFNATSSPNTNFKHILSSYVSTTNSISDTTIINNPSQFSTHSALPGSVTAIATDRVDEEEGIYINTPDHKDSKDEKLETLLPHQTQEFTHSNVERLEAILPQHQPQEFIIHNEALETILPQHQPQEFLNSQSEASETNLPQHQPQQYTIPEQSDRSNLEVKPYNNPMQVNIESGLPGEYYGYYTGDTFSDLSPGDYFLKPLKSSLDESLGDVDPNSSFSFSNSLVIGEVPARERARALNGDSLNINVFASQTADKEKTKQKTPINLNQQKSHYNINYQAFKNFSLNGSNSTFNTVNSSQLISNLANIRISSLANPNSTTPFLHHIISNPSNLNPILINSRPALHLVPPIPDSLPYIGPAAPTQAKILSYSAYNPNKTPADASIASEHPILRPDAMRPSYSRPSHRSSQLRPPPPHSPPPPHTPILETIIGRGRAPRPYSFKKQSDTHETQQSKLVEQKENNDNPGNWTVKENHSFPQQVYVQILPSSFRNIPHLETSFLPPRDGRKLHGRSGRGHSFAPPILVPQGAHTHPVYLQLQNNRQNRYIPLRHSPIIGT